MEYALPDLSFGNKTRAPFVSPTTHILGQWKEVPSTKTSANNTNGGENRLTSPIKCVLECDEPASQHHSIGDSNVQVCVNVCVCGQSVSYL